MASRSRRTGFCTLLVASLMAHGGLLYGLHQSAHAAVPQPLPKARVTLKMAAIKPPAPPLAAESEGLPAAPIATRHAKERKAEKHADAPKKTSRPVEAAAETAAADFTGLTLTNPNGGFASVTGNGEPMQGPLGAPARGTRTGTGTGSGWGAGSAESERGAVIGLASLSRLPKAPALDDALRANYPAQARAQGTPGHALVRARILADGRVGDTRVLLASAPEFGRACQRTLSGSRWSAPLDKGGQPVSTEVSYQCQFEVSQ
jgi:TonB family protein